MEVCAVHARQDLFALSPAGASEISIFSSLSLQCLQKFPEAGCSALAWHPEGPTLAALVIRGSGSCTVLIFTNAAAERHRAGQGIGYGLRLRCAHQVQLGTASAAAVFGKVGHGLCWAPGHLIAVWGTEIGAWPCTFSGWRSVMQQLADGAHFLHCAEEPFMQRSLQDASPVSDMLLDGSYRFLATVHERGYLRVWSVAEGCHVEGQAAGYRCRLPRHKSSLPSSSRAEVCPIDGIVCFVLSHSEDIRSVQWCPAIAREHDQAATLVVVTMSGSVTLWRENSSSEFLVFSVEAFWSSQDFWEGSPNPTFGWSTSVRWMQPRRVAVGYGVDREDVVFRAGLPLRANGHFEGSGATSQAGCHLTCPVPPSRSLLRTSTLIALRADGYVAVLHFQEGNSRKMYCPLEIHRMILPVPLPTGSFHSSFVAHAAVVVGDAADALEVWLMLGSDIVRARLEQDEHATILAVAGGALTQGSFGNTGGASDSKLIVEQMVVHCILGMIACHVRDPSTSSSLIWISDAPRGRSSVSGEKYILSEASLLVGGHGVACNSQGLKDLLWAPGRVVPPVLLGVSANGGELLSRVVDPVRGAIGPGAWSTVLCCLTSSDEKTIQDVIQIQAVCEDDDERAMVCVVQQQPSAPHSYKILVARLEVTGAVGSHTLHVLYVHTSSAAASGLRAAMEWMSSLGPFCSSLAQGGVVAGQEDSSPKPGDLVGQLAVWPSSVPDEAIGTASVECIYVYTLVIASAQNGSVAVKNSDETLVRARVSCDVAVLALALSGIWLVALTSQSQVLVWCLTATCANSSGQHVAELRCKFFLAMKPLARQQVSASSKSTLRAWNQEGGATNVSNSGRTIGLHGGPSERGGAAISAGSLSLQHFASGGLGILASGCSDSEIALPALVMCSQSSSDGYAWHLLDLYTSSLPIASQSLSWMNDGSIAFAGSGNEKPNPLAVFAANLPAEASQLLLSSVPCPAYHPDTLFWLERRGQAQFATRICENLLKTVQGPRTMGVPPLVGIDYDDFSIGADAIEENKLQPVVSKEECKAPVVQTASSLFDDDDDTDARLARLTNFSAMATSWESDEDEEEASDPEIEDDAPARRQSSCSAAEEKDNWRPSEETANQLADYLQTAPLPLVSSAEQTHLMCLLQERSNLECMADLDECARRFMQAFELHVSIVRRPVFGAAQRCHSSLNAVSSRESGIALLGERLSSEDICWALHSTCQNTIVDRILQTFDIDLDWLSLRKVGLGLWLTDHAARTKVLEALPRNIMKKQGKDDFEPESVALWYALLGKRSLLATLYKQQKQPRISEFLSNNLAEEPHRTKAKKNAFELIKQRRFETACAFFLFAKCSRDAVDVCVRYLEDWPLAMLIAQQARVEADEEVATELQRVLQEDLLPLARNARDPWLASIAHWHAGNFGEAAQCITPPYKLSLAGEDDFQLESSKLFMGGVLRHGGVSPSLSRFVQVLKEVLAKRRLTEISLQISASAAAVATSQAYLARRQPLLALLPTQGSIALPWRDAVGIARSLVSLVCQGGQPLVSPDGVVALASVAKIMGSRLGLPYAVVRAIISQVSFETCSQDAEMDSAAVFVNTTSFYSPSSSNRCNEDEGVGSQVSRLPHYLHAYVTGFSDWKGTSEFRDEICFCRELRCLTLSHASRSLAFDERVARSAVLAALVWRTMPRLRAYLQDPAQMFFPSPSLHLAAHLICALCVSRPPSPIISNGISAPQPSELPGDLAHIVTALVVTLATLLALSTLTPSSGMWGSPESAAEPKSVTERGSRKGATEAYLMYLVEEENAAKEDSDEESTNAESEVQLPPWKATFWQGLRVLLEHLRGDTAEQRRLHRSGVIPSLILSLFLRPSFISDDPMGGTATSSTVDSTPAPSIAESAPCSPKLASSPSRSHASESGDESAGNAPEMQPEDALRHIVGALSRNADADKQFQALLQCVLVELAIEWLVGLFSGIRKKSSGAAGHWITAWYESLLSSLRGFLRHHVSDRVVQAAKVVAENHDRLALALCAPEPKLNEVFANIATSGDGHGQSFLALWQQLNGTRRLLILFTHHPSLGFIDSQIPRHSAILWKCGAGVPIRFACVDRTSPMRLAAHVRTTTSELHVGYAVRWFNAFGPRDDEDAISCEVANQRYDSVVDRFVQTCLGTAYSTGSIPAFDVSAEMLLARSCQDQSRHPPPAFAGVTDVAHFLATLQRVGVGAPPPAETSQSFTVASSSAPMRCALLHAEAHPSRPIYAAAAEDSSMYLWAFGESTPRCVLPRASESEARSARKTTVSMPGANPTMMRGASTNAARDNDTRSSSVDASETAAIGGSTQRKCTLAWNSVGDRLLGVGSNTGTSLWTIGEGRGACQASTVPVGSAHAKTNCGIFVSPGCVIATAGLRSDSATAWPHHAAGICIWDTLSPPSRALVAHDGNADGMHQMPAEYVCLTWDADQQHILCGTKSGELRVFDLRQGRISQRFTAHDTTIRNCFSLPSSQRFLTLSASAELKLWSASSFDCLETRPRLHSLRGVGSMLGKATALTCATLVSEHHLVTGGHDGVLLLTHL